MTPLGGYDPYNPSSNQGMAMIPQQQMVQPVGQQVMTVPPRFGGITQYVFTTDPLAELNNIHSVIIKQQPEFLEAYSGCETQNRYHVFGLTQMGYVYLFKCLERSGWCTRNCLASSIRPFTMEIRHIASIGQFDPSFSKNFANALRNFKCTCFCLNRPEIIVSLSDSGKFVGKIINPFTFCDPEFEVYNTSGELKYLVKGDCCQCGLLCSNNFCGKLSEVYFPIYKGRGGGQVGNIVKKVAQLHEMVTDADTYMVDFPNDATPEEKLLLISLGLFIDYLYFEEEASDQRENRRRNMHNRGYYY